MKAGTKVRYVGRSKQYIRGETGTVIDSSVKVRWDYNGKETIVSEKALEVVTGISRCKTPTLPGHYLIKCGFDSVTLAEVRKACWCPGLEVRYGNSVTSMTKLNKRSDIRWWGPLEVL